MTLTAPLRATVAFVALFAASPAFAIDGQAVFDRLAAQLERQGLTLGTDGVKTDGDRVEITNATVKPEGTAAPINLNTIVLDGVVDAPNDGYLVERLAIAGAEVNNEKTNFAFDGALIEGLFIAGPNEPDPILSGNLYRRLTMGPLVLGPAGVKAFSISGLTAEMSEYQPGGTLDFTMKMSDMNIDFATFPDPKTKQALTALGYEQISGEMTGKGTWNTTTGALVMDDMTLKANDAADLHIAFELGGYTPELVAAMQAATRTMKGNEQAMGMAIMGMMQQIDVSSIVIKLEDQSLTGRLLDFFGTQQGMNRESTVAMAKGFLPLGLAQLQAPEFAAKANAAIGTYLGDPKSLTIEAKPANPVPMAQLMAAGATGPAAIIAALNVRVIANE